jgi:hypothetical protein
MNSVAPGAFHPLLDQTIVAVERLALTGAMESNPPLVDTGSLLFTLQNGRRWEFLDAQDSDLNALQFKEISADSDLVACFDLSREPDEFAITVPLDGYILPLPWFVTNITEVWSPHHEPPYWRGTTLWHFPRDLPIASRPPGDLASGRALISLFSTVDTGIWVGPVAEWWDYLHFDHAFVHRTEYFFYGSPALWTPAP